MQQLIHYFASLAIACYSACHGQPIELRELLEKSRRVRETFYRYTLADLLWFAFGDEDAGRRPSEAVSSNDPRWPQAVDITTLDDEEFEHFVLRNPRSSGRGDPAGGRP